jgi:hypothetical protein
MQLVFEGERDMTELVEYIVARLWVRDAPT